MVVSKRFIAVPSSRHRRRAWLRYPFVLRSAWSEQMTLSLSAIAGTECWRRRRNRKPSSGIKPYYWRLAKSISLASTRTSILRTNASLPIVSSGASQVAARISSSISRSRRTSAIVSPMCRSILESITARSSMPSPHQALPRPVIHTSWPIGHTDVFDKRARSFCRCQMTPALREERDWRILLALHGNGCRPWSVSYTHLTLPTIYSV